MVFGGMVIVGVLLFGLWWVWFLVLVVFEISVVVYLVGLWIGVFVYNLMYFYVVLFLLMIFGVGFGVMLLIVVGGLWLVYIGILCVMGFGLKYLSGYCDIYLGCIGLQLWLCCVVVIYRNIWVLLCG